MAQRVKGVVRVFDGSKGYGYIQAQGLDVFVHYSAIASAGLQNLREGEQVEFTLEESFRGPQAAQVIRLN
ncbi:MAG: cold shock domain-containing protein [Anaerolineales bacterium]|nr:cold shock domain-containing protein [Anaerolineales bacterium]MBL8055673.1 cold shock domain-containing protein [Anaerolineales bacterium]